MVTEWPSGQGCTDDGRSRFEISPLPDCKRVSFQSKLAGSVHLQDLRSTKLAGWILIRIVELYYNNWLQTWNMSHFNDMFVVFATRESLHALNSGLHRQGSTCIQRSLPSQRIAEDLKDDVNKHEARFFFPQGEAFLRCKWNPETWMKLRLVGARDAGYLKMKGDFWDPKSSKECKQVVLYRCGLNTVVFSFQEAICVWSNVTWQMHWMLHAEISWTVSRDMHGHTTLYHIVSLLFGASPVVLFWAHSVSSWASQSKKGNIVLIPQRSQKGEASKTELHATTNNSFLLNSWYIWAIQSSPKPSQTCAENPHGGRRSCHTPTPDPERPPRGVGPRRWPGHRVKTTKKRRRLARTAEHGDYQCLP